MPQRFVILHHLLTDGEHWDFMLEEGEALRTWQLFREPVGRESLPIPARLIGNHRKAYLQYEGPVSGGRGTVRRIDQGTVRVTQSTAEAVQFELLGSRLVGCLTLTLVQGEDWVLDVVEDPQKDCIQGCRSSGKHAH